MCDNCKKPYTFEDLDVTADAKVILKFMIEALETNTSITLPQTIGILTGQDYKAKQHMVDKFKSKLEKRS